MVVPRANGTEYIVDKVGGLLTRPVGRGGDGAVEVEAARDA